MNSESFRRGRWAADPERIDPDDYPPQQPFVKLLTWAPCPACELQVHVPVTRFLLQGLICPSCEAVLLSPPDDPSALLGEALRREDELSAELD
jgi:hypothetical protein